MRENDRGNDREASAEEDGLPDVGGKFEDATASVDIEAGGEDEAGSEPDPDGHDAPSDSDTESDSIEEEASEEPDPEAEESAGLSGAEELELALEDLRVLRDQHLRLAADFENYRKRVSADLAAGWVRAQADLVRTLTEGLDDLQRVSQFTSEDTTVEALIEGVDLVERKLLKALTDAGLEVLDPQDGAFDPNTMEAMMRVPTEEDGQDDTVHQVFQKGYLFKDQLVRPARVSVYKDDD